MTDRLVISLAQINPVVGDVRGNLARIRAARAEAGAADLVVFPELCLSGYPPEDLVLKPFFLESVEQAVAELAAETVGGPALLVGAPWRQDGRTYNAILLLDAGKVEAAQFKVELPNYGVFDEKRVFSAGPLPGPVNLRGVRIGVPICEDIWIPDVVECLEESGAELIIALNASPFEHDKAERRMNTVLSHVVESALPFIYLNQVGGQDELVFDGGSFAIGADSSLRVQLPRFEERIVSTVWTRQEAGWACEEAERADPSDGLEAIYRAMVLGLRDYVGKNGFPGVLIGLSGGIDSALSAAVAVDAVGADKVHCVMMPSPYTSRESLEDAAECARLLGCRLDEISIEPAMEAFDAMLKPFFDGRPADIAEENIQSRARGVTLMALSNKFGPMVLSTGNKSEVSVGYATLYGDMCGGYSVLKDVYKTTVFALSRWRNQMRPAGSMGPEGRVMPEHIIAKPPSAELRPDQKDEDSLPPYETLDDILNCLVEQDLGLSDIVARGHAPEMVAKVWRLLDRAEYKRRQAPPGVKITSRSFGRDRRYPITNATVGMLS